MPSSRRSRGSRATPSVGLQEGRLGRRNKLAEQWNTRFEELLKYKSEHGDCNVPGKQGKLGIWVRTQRVAYMAGSIAQDRIDRLDGIGFNWKHEKFEQWNARFKELLNYRSEHGHCDVPQSQGQLGAWVKTQRSAYKAGSLAQDRARIGSVVSALSGQS